MTANSDGGAPDRETSPRRYSQRSLPPYRHVPGETPHPERDPAGHMFGRSEAAPEGWSPESWRDNELYLYAVDLFNLGYWWEAHAAWEALWQTRREEPVGAFLQGLIQVAAALVQYRAGRREGARKVASKGLSHLRRLSSGLGTSAEGVPTTYMGVDIGRFADAVERFLGLGKPGEGRPTEAAPPVLDLA